MLNILFLCFKEFRTAAPFHRLHPSQRSASETAINITKRTTTGGLSGEHSGSMSALPDHRLSGEFGSRYSLPADSHGYRGGTFEQDDYRKPQSGRSGAHNPGSTSEHSSKHVTTTSITGKKKPIPDEPQSLTSDSSSSDD